MLRHYLKTKINYDKDKNVLTHRLLKTLENDIRQDIIGAFEIAKPFIDNYPELYNNSTSFFDFLTKLLKVDNLQPSSNTTTNTTTNTTPHVVSQTQQINENFEEIIQKAIKNLNLPSNEFADKMKTIYDSVMTDFFKRIIDTIEKNSEKSRKNLEEMQNILKDSNEKNVEKFMKHMENTLQNLQNNDDQFEDILKNFMVKYNESLSKSLKKTFINSIEAEIIPKLDEIADSNIDQRMLENSFKTIIQQTISHQIMEAIKNSDEHLVSQIKFHHDNTKNQYENMVKDELKNAITYFNDKQTSSVAVLADNELKYAKLQTDLIQYMEFLKNAIHRVDSNQKELSMAFQSSNNALQWQSQLENSLREMISMKSELAILNKNLTDIPLALPPSTESLNYQTNQQTNNRSQLALQSSEMVSGNSIVVENVNEKELEDKINKLQNEIEYLRQSKEARENELKSKIESLKRDHRNEMQEMDSKSEKYQEKIEKLNVENVKIKKNINDLKSEINSLTIHKNDIENEIEERKKSHDKCLEDLNQQRTRNDELTREIETLKRRREEYYKNRNGIENEIGEWKKSHDKCLEDLNQQRTRNDELTREIETLKRQHKEYYENITREINEYRQRNGTLESKIEEMNKRVYSTNDDALRNENVQLKQDNIEIRQQSEKLLSEIKRLNKSINTYQQQFENTQEQYQNDFRQLTAENQLLKQKNDEWELKHDALEKNIHENLTIENEKLMEEESRKNEILIDLTDKYERLDLNYQQLREKLQECIRNNEILMQKDTDNNILIQSLREDNSKSSMFSNGERLHQLKTEIENKNKILMENGDRINALSEQIKIINSQNEGRENRYKTDLQNLITEKENLESAVNELLSFKNELKIYLLHSFPEMVTSHNDNLLEDIKNIFNFLNDKYAKLDLNIREEINKIEKQVKIEIDDDVYKFADNINRFIEHLQFQIDEKSEELNNMHSGNFDEQSKYQKLYEMAENNKLLIMAMFKLKENGDNQGMWKDIIEAIKNLIVTYNNDVETYNNLVQNIAFVFQENINLTDPIHVTRAAHYIIQRNKFLPYVEELIVWLNDCFKKPKYIKIIDDDDNEPECCVCMEKVVKGTKILNLECKHIYDNECFERLLKNQDLNCPLCRKLMLPDCIPPKKAAINVDGQPGPSTLDKRKYSDSDEYDNENMDDETAIKEGKKLKSNVCQEILEFCGQKEKTTEENIIQVFERNNNNEGVNEQKEKTTEENIIQVFERNNNNEDVTEQKEKTTEENIIQVFEGNNNEEEEEEEKNNNGVKKKNLKTNKQQTKKHKFSQKLAKENEQLRDQIDNLKENLDKCEFNLKKCVLEKEQMETRYKLLIKQTEKDIKDRDNECEEQLEEKDTKIQELYHLNERLQEQIDDQIASQQFILLNSRMETNSFVIKQLHKIIILLFRAHFLQLYDILSDKNITYDPEDMLNLIETVQDYLRQKSNANIITGILFEFLKNYILTISGQKQETIDYDDKDFTGDEFDEIKNYFDNIKMEIETFVKRSIKKS